MTTSTELVASKSVYFPAVTVCNLNRINCRHLYSEFINQYVSDESSPVFKKLQNIFEMSGCNDQICTALMDAVHDMRVDTKEDQAVVNLAYLGCEIKAMQQQRVSSKFCNALCAFPFFLQ